MENVEKVFTFFISDGIIQVEIFYLLAVALSGGLPTGTRRYDMILYYVRHGDPIYNPDSLTPLGHRQAEAVGRRFAVHGLDKIYSSPSVRARQTAMPTCEILKKDMVVLDWCCESLAWNDMTVEYEQGKLTWAFFHRPTRELFTSPEVRALGDKWYTYPAFENTRFEAGVKRVREEADKFMLSLGYRHDVLRSGYIAEEPTDERVALFAHQGFGLLFLSTILDIPYNDFSTRFDIGHTGVSVIEFSASKGGFCIPRLLQHSNDSHLYKEGLGTRYQNEIFI